MRIVPRILSSMALALAFATASSAEDSSAKKSPSTLPEAEAIFGAKKISMDFRSAPLKVVFDHLQEQAGFNFIVDPEVLKDFEAKGMTASLHLEGLNMLDAVRTILDIFDMKMYFSGDVLLFTLPERFWIEPVLRVYDVSRLVQTRRDSPGKVRDIFSAYATGTQDNEDPVRGEPDVSAADIVELIQNYTAWDSEQGRIAIMNRSIALTQTPKVHDHIAELLAVIEADLSTELTVRIKVVPVPASALPHVPTEHLSDQEMDAFTRSFAPPGSTLDLVTVAANGRRTHVFSGKQQYFIRHTINDAPDRSPVASGVLADVEVWWSEGPTTDCVLRFSGSGDLSISPGLASMPFLQCRMRLETRIGMWTPAASGPAALAPSWDCAAVFVRIDPTAPLPLRRDKEPQRYEGDLKVIEALRTKRLSVDFKDIPLFEALTELTTRTGVNLVISPRVFDEKAENDLLVQLKVDDIPLCDLLQIIMHLKNLTYRLSHGVVHVVNPEGAMGAAEKRRFPIHHLFGSQDLNGGLHRFFEDEFPDFRRPKDEEGPLTGEALVSLIRETIAPYSWDTPPNDIHYLRGTLFIANQSSVIEKIDELLGKFRIKTATPVRVTGFLLDSMPAIPQSAGGNPSVLDRMQAEAIDAKLKSGEIKAREGFFCTGLKNRYFSCSSGRQAACAEPGGKLDFYQDRCFLDGMTADMIVTAADQGGSLSLQISAYFAKYAWPENPFTDNPTAETLSFRTRVAIPQGGAALIGGGAPNASGGYLYLKVR